MVKAQGNAIVLEFSKTQCTHYKQLKACAALGEKHLGQQWTDTLFYGLNSNQCLQLIFVRRCLTYA